VKQITGTTTLDELQAMLLELDDRFGVQGQAGLQIQPPRKADDTWSASTEGLAGFSDSPRATLAQAVEAAFEASRRWRKRGKL
jgi:hypothetical protein